MELSQKQHTTYSFDAHTLSRTCLPTPLYTSRDVRTALEDTNLAGGVAIWFLKLQKLPQFQLAIELHPEVT